MLFGQLSSVLKFIKGALFECCPKIRKLVRLCSQYFKNIKQGGYFAPPVK